MLQFSLKDLELFVAVAEAGSIAKAGQQCHTAASAVSKRISDLEQFLHTPLLCRSGPGVSLTLAGHSFLVRARGVLNQATQLDEELRRILRGCPRSGAGVCEHLGDCAISAQSLGQVPGRASGDSDPSGGARQQCNRASRDRPGCRYRNHQRHSRRQASAITNCFSTTTNWRSWCGQAIN